MTAQCGIWFPPDEYQYFTGSVPLSKVPLGSRFAGWVNPVIATTDDCLCEFVRLELSPLEVSALNMAKVGYVPVIRQRRCRECSSIARKARRTGLYKDKLQALYKNHMFFVHEDCPVRYNTVMDLIA